MTETRTFTFAGTRGDRLAGRLDLPDGKPRAVVLVAHCFSGGNAGLAAARIARSFTELSMAVFSLDFARARHAGEKPAGATFGLGVDDLAIAADQLRSTMAAPSILVGHSHGGAAVLAIAARVPEARAVVTLAMPKSQNQAIGNVRMAAMAAQFLGRITPMADDEQSTSSAVPRLIQEFIDQLLSMAPWPESGR